MSVRREHPAKSPGGRSPPASICIIRLSAIGDCCHTLAVARSIQTAWPDTPVTWIIGRTEYGLMKGISGIEFITFDKSAGYRGYQQLRREIGNREFAVLLHMHASMRANLASLCVRAKTRLGFDRLRARDYQWLFTNERIPARPRQHVMDGMFQFLEHFGLSERSLHWDIPVSEADREFAESICGQGRPVCVISPCSSQRFRNFRNWAAGNFSALADYLHQRHKAHIILTGGNTRTEKQYGQEIQAGLNFPVSNLIGETNLKQLLAILGCADIVICPDSGPAHMATAVGTPVVGLYATSNRYRTGPYHSQQFVADRYPDAVQLEFGKPVDQVKWGQRVRNPDAMNLIKLADVTRKVDLVLSQVPSTHSVKPDPALYPEDNANGLTDSHD
jgi:heptosyltransferase I